MNSKKINYSGIISLMILVIVLTGCTGGVPGDAVQKIRRQEQQAPQPSPSFDMDALIDDDAIKGGRCNSAVEEVCEVDLNQ